MSNDPRLGSIAVSGHGQDPGAQRLDGFSLDVIERAGVKRIDQGQQLAAVGWGSRRLAESALSAYISQFEIRTLRTE